MRILIVSHYFWPEAFRINDLAKTLRARGHQLHVLTSMPNYPHGRFYKGYGVFKKWRDSFDGVPIDRVPFWPRFGGGRIHLALNYLSFIVSATLLGLPRLTGRYDASFVFAVSPLTSCLPAIFYKWLTGTPVVIWVQDLWPESVSAVGAIRNSWVLKLIEKLVRFIYAQSDLILIQSEAFRPNVEKLTGTPEKIHYLPNWAEDIYVPVSREAVNGPARELPEGFRVVFAGNVGRAQALPTLVEAAGILREHQDIHWIVLGDGTEREKSIRTVAEKGLSDRVHFLGRKPMELMPQYFAMADALLVTLKNDRIFSYTIPSRVQSYFACGRPIIAALDGEGTRVVEESGAGFAGASEDAQQLAANVLRLYRLAPEQREGMGRRGLDYYKKNFDRDMLIGGLERKLEALESNSSHAH